MLKTPTRREFIKLTGAAALTASTLNSSANAGEPDRNISVWVTDGEHRFARVPSIPWQSASSSESANEIVLRPERKLQEILGFGAAFTDASCFTFNRLDADARARLFHQLFHPSEMGFSVCRTCIGASDYSASVYSFDEGEPDPDLKRFSIEHDRAYILPMLRAARKANPDLFLFSSPWSPPGWMKSNNSMLGGNMQRRSMAPYANYLVKFLRGYEGEGVPVQAITVQNEVDTDQDSRMPACTWPMEYEADFVRQYLGPLFEREQVETKIWLIDHNYNLWGRAIGELETGEVHKYSNAIAWHGYVGKIEWIDRVRDRYPGIEMYWTEGGPDYTDPNYAKDWAQWSATFTGILRHWCRSITAWNFALDEHGKPNIGPFNCGGLVTIHSQSKEISYSGQFWAFAHYARVIRRGARRFESEGASDLQHVAFENPDGKRVVVITNPGPATIVKVRLGDRSAEVQLSANSIATLGWTS